MKHHIVYIIKIVENKNLFFFESEKLEKNIHYFTFISNKIIYFFLLIDISMSLILI